MSLDIEDARDFMIGIYLLAFGIFGAVTEFWYLSAAGAGISADVLSSGLNEAVFIASFCACCFCSRTGRRQASSRVGRRARATTDCLSKQPRSDVHTQNHRCTDGGD